MTPGPNSSPAPVRSVHMSVRVEHAEPPNDTAHVRLFYPAAPTGSDRERLTGELPPDRSGAPLPVVIMLPAVNVGSDTYRWLAVELVHRGFAVVTYNHVGVLMPGQCGLSPGIDLEALSQQTFGTRPSATAVAPILAALGAANADGPMHAMLDLGRVALGGHSAGGTVALENADPVWFEGVGAVFTYGSHTVPVAVLGHGEDAVLAVGPVPALIVAGEDDGVISASSDRYGAEVGSRAHSPVSRTYDRGVSGETAAYEVILAGSNHLLVCDPPDPTSARGFLDTPPRMDPAGARATFVDLVGAFLARHLLDDHGARPLEVAQESEVVASVRAKGSGVA